MEYLYGEAYQSSRRDQRWPLWRYLTRQVIQVRVRRDLGSTSFQIGMSLMLKSVITAVSTFWFFLLLPDHTFAIWHNSRNFASPSHYLLVFNSVSQFHRQFFITTCRTNLAHRHRFPLSDLVRTPMMPQFWPHEPLDHESFVSRIWSCSIRIVTAKHIQNDFWPPDFLKATGVFPIGKTSDLTCSLYLWGKWYPVTYYPK